jgi:diaminohydroxyphosphoribosylaminopyrimidine deaminase/5-amino-6-(5-phosphoribosylamino)uracil reductase
VIVLPTGPNGALDLNALMRWLGAHEINEVHVEAGPRLQGALVAGGHVDEWVAYVAPSILGEGQGLASLPAPLASLDRACRFEFLDAVKLGADMRLRLRHPGHWQALRAACGLPA